MVTGCDAATEEAGPTGGVIASGAGTDGAFFKKLSKGGGIVTGRGNFFLLQNQSNNNNKLFWMQ